MYQMNGRKISREKGVHSAYDPTPGLGEAAGKRVDAVGDVRLGPGDGRSRHNLCNTTTN